ncbi:MAG: MFS transporter [Alphaproteobacteria bacterium]|nr:MFS transporter [Alphaproteobacteria bacterium]
MMRIDYELKDLPLEAQKHSRIFRIHRFIDAASVGFFAVIILLLLQSRGFGLFDIAVLLAVFSGTSLVLELPLGGLADGIGRKPVFMLSIVAFLLSILTLILFESYWLTMLSLVFMGLRMALVSGTLAAWFVEKFNRLAPEFSTQPVLAKNQFAMLMGQAISSVAGGVIADFYGSSFIDYGIGKFELPLVGAFILGIVVFIYTHFLIIEDRHKIDLVLIKSGFSNLGHIIYDSGIYGFKHRFILLMLVGTTCTSLALYTFQTFWVPFVKPMLNDGYAASIIGILTFGYYSSQAFGSMIAAPAIRLFNGDVAKALAGLTFICALCLIGISFTTHIYAFIVMLALYTLFVGSTSSPHKSIFHEHIPDDKRSTLLSLEALMARLGGLVGLLFIGYIADEFSIATAFKAGTIFIFAASFLYYILSRRIRNISNH